MINFAETFVAIVKILAVGFDKIRCMSHSHEVRKFAALVDELRLQTFEKFFMLVLNAFKTSLYLGICNVFIRLFLSSVHFLVNKLFKIKKLINKTCIQELEPLLSQFQFPSPNNRFDGCI